MMLAQVEDLDCWPVGVASLVGLVAFCAIPVLRAWAQTRRARALRRRRMNLCPACGYSLVGNVSGVCPECGTPEGTAGR